MKNFDDSKLYLYFAIITFVITIVLALITYYSIQIVEPRVEKLLSVDDNFNENFRKAYIILKDPQIFARYENYDNISFPIKKIISDFDNRINNQEEFYKNDRVYLEILLERRILGSRLSRNTMIFFLLLSILGWFFYFHENRR